MSLKTKLCVIFLFQALLGGMDSCAELGTLVVWASSFKKYKCFYFLSVYFITETWNWNKMVTWSSTAEKKQPWRAESLQNQIFLWITIICIEM